MPMIIVYNKARMSQAISVILPDAASFWITA